MKTIKIIELLNKIANEEVPKKIKYIGYIFEYDTNHERYEAYIDGEISTLGEYVNINDSLNDEVEIIEEKKILEKLEILNANEHSKEVYYENYSKQEISLDIETLQNWVNKIIDYLESKGE